MSKKLFLMSGGNYGFAYDFYTYVLKDFGFRLYQLDFNAKLSRTKYFLHLLRKKYDTIWCCGCGRGFLTLWAKIMPLFLKAKLKNTEIIVHFHRGVKATFEESEWQPYTMIMAADKVVWVYNCFDELKKYVPMISPSKFFVVHNGIDLNVYKPDDAKREQKVIFTVSNWYLPRKRLDILISAMELLPDWKLIVGGNFLQKDYETHCKTLAKNYGDRVRFLGLVIDRASWMQKASFFVMPSLSESWSTQVMEAMACGCKVVRVEGGGSLEFVPKEELLPQNFDAKLLVERISKLDENNEIVDLNRRQVEKFSWSRIYEETKKVFSNAGEKN